MERPSIYFWMAVLVIVLQVLMCAAMAHMDADDCFYVAAATTDVHTDSIFAVDPYTGCEYRVLPRRYVLSPFPVFLAVASRLSGGMHPAVMAHMVFCQSSAYGIYGAVLSCRKNVFRGKKSKRYLSPSDSMYMQFLGIFCIQYREFSNGSDSGRERLFLASVLLPYLLYLCISIFLGEKKKIHWTALFLTNISCCLLSSMGIILAPLMTGCFLAASFVMQREWKTAAKGFLCCLPSIVLGVAYILIG